MEYHRVEREAVGNSSENNPVCRDAPGSVRPSLTRPQVIVR